MSDDLSKVEFRDLNEARKHDAMVWDRMEALVRKLAGGRGHMTNDCKEARAIVALLPEAVDPDLVEAREICLKQAIDEGCDEADMYHHYSKATVEGNASVRLAVTCIRRGLALERDSREG